MVSHVKTTKHKTKLAGGSCKLSFLPTYEKLIKPSMYLLTLLQRMHKKNHLIKKSQIT